MKGSSIKAVAAPLLESSAFSAIFRPPLVSPSPVIGCSVLLLSGSAVRHRHRQQPTSPPVNLQFELKTEQMSGVVNELDSINFSIKKASKLVKEIGRQIKCWDRYHGTCRDIT